MYAIRRKEKHNRTTFHVADKTASRGQNIPVTVLSVIDSGRVYFRRVNDVSDRGRAVPEELQSRDARCFRK